MVVDWGCELELGAVESVLEVVCDCAAVALELWLAVVSSLVYEDDAWLDAIVGVASGTPYQHKFSPCVESNAYQK